jgi:hypothetical protein
MPTRFEGGDRGQAQWTCRLDSPNRGVVRTARLVRRISLPSYVDVVRAAEVAEFRTT